MKRIYCKCGCGGKVTRGRIFMVGHARRGRRNSLKHCEGISTGQLAFYQTLAGKRKRAIISKVNSTRIISPETRLKGAETRRKRFNSVEGDETRKKLSEGMLRWWASRKGSIFREKMSNRQRRWWALMPDDERNKRIINWLSTAKAEGACARPNKLEAFLLMHLKPLGFEYTGDFSVWIVQQNPDFVYRKKKIIVELFGRYWHPDPKEEKRRIDKYKKSGYKAIVIWDDKLNDNLPQQINRVRRLLT